MKERKISVAAVQETGCREDAEYEISEYKIILLKCCEADSHKTAGLGFILSREWADRLETTQRINDRIATATFRISDEQDGRSDTIAIVNGYGYTMMTTDENPERTDSWFAKIHDTYRKINTGKFLTITMADFNSKVGEQLEGEEDIIGKYGRGQRNENGNRLLQYAGQNNLCLTNTYFQHKQTYRGTWHKQQSSTNPDTGNNNILNIHNMIDYILIPQHRRELVTDSKAIPQKAMKYMSDHSIVIMTIRLANKTRMPKKQHTRIPQKAYDVLWKGRQGGENDDGQGIRKKYELQIARDIVTKNNEEIDRVIAGGARYTAAERSATLNQIVSRAAETLLPPAAPPIVSNLRYLADPELRGLLIERKTLRSKRYDRRKGKNDQEKITAVAQKQKQNFRAIRRRTREMQDEHLNGIAEDIEREKGNRRVYTALSTMKRGQKKRKFVLEDIEGHKIHQISQQIAATTNWYDSFFNQEGRTEPQQWRGIRRRLAQPISDIEVTSAAKRLGNNKAVGPDGIRGEALKYAGPNAHLELAIIYNEIFERHEPIPELKHSYLFILNKPITGQKRPRVENTRPLAIQST